MVVVKILFRYLKGITNFCLWCPKYHELTLNFFTNVDWIGGVDDRKSTSSGAFFLVKKLIYWLSKKKNIISLSTIEENYISSSINFTNVLWMKKY
jgi:hypothetical protein